MKTFFKTIFSSKVNSMILFMVIVLTGQVNAGPRVKGENEADKVTTKTREAVAQAAPDDWFTLATSADKCIKRNVNLKEANEWLDKSIQIKETPYNLELKGDYYVKNKLPEKAMEYYVKSIQAGNSSGKNFDAGPVQAKILEIRKSVK